MPALKPTNFSCRIVWLGYVPDRKASLRSQSVTEAEVTFAGYAGENHAGLTRPSDSRVISQHPRGTEIRNVRQFSIVSSEDLAAIASKMGLEKMDAAWIGASIVVEGIPHFTHVPPSSRLQGPDGVTLVIDMENRPCNLPAPVINEEAPGFGAAFKAAANGRRGVTAWVERQGTLRVGDELRLHIPDQPVWPQLETARASGG